MKIVAISDTHNLHKRLHLPKGDAIIHCGDFSVNGSESEIKDFISWFDSLSGFKYRIFISGNHDKAFDSRFSIDKKRPKWLSDILNSLNKNTIYLENNSVSIEGKTFFGSPWSLWYNGDKWEFNYKNDEANTIWSNIPKETDILLTHAPPFKILDYIPKNKVNAGCSGLLENIKNKMIRHHFFGHIHESFGNTYENGIFFHNVTSINQAFHTRDAVVVDI